VSNGVFDDLAAKREVLSLRVVCSRRDEFACTWAGELRDLDAHVRQCEDTHRPVTCPNGCSTSTRIPTSPLLTRRTLPAHLELECPMRSIKCELCDMQVTAAQVAYHHLLQCAKFRVRCAACGEAGIPRDRMAEHKSVVCGKTLLPCSFRSYGCLHEDQRARMAAHYAEANMQHIMMMSSSEAAAAAAQQHKHQQDSECSNGKMCVRLSDLLGQTAAPSSSEPVILVDTVEEESKRKTTD
jgi:hypothetical protein